MVARGGQPFHELPTRRGPIAMLRRLLGLPLHTRYYERLDGARVLLTDEEASEIAPIELEMMPKHAARRIMRNRRERKAG